LTTAYFAWERARKLEKMSDRPKRTANENGGNEDAEWKEKSIELEVKSPAKKARKGKKDTAAEQFENEESKSVDGLNEQTADQSSSALDLDNGLDTMNVTQKKRGRPAKSPPKDDEVTTSSSSSSSEGQDGGNAKTPKEKEDDAKENVINQVVKDESAERTEGEGTSNDKEKEKPASNQSPEKTPETVKVNEAKSANKPKGTESSKQKEFKEANKPANKKTKAQKYDEDNDNDGDYKDDGDNEDEEEEDDYEGSEAEESDINDYEDEEGDFAAKKKNQKKKKSQPASIHSSSSASAGGGRGDNKKPGSRNTKNSESNGKLANFASLSKPVMPTSPVHKAGLAKIGSSDVSAIKISPSGAPLRRVGLSRAVPKTKVV